MPPNDSKYYPYPKNVYLHDNTYSGNGTAPDIRNQIGLLLNTLTLPVKDVMYDGIVNTSAGTGMNPMQICVKESKADGVCDMHFDKLDSQHDNLPQIIDCTAAFLSCTLPALPAVTWTGLSQ